MRFDLHTEGESQVIYGKEIVRIRHCHDKSAPIALERNDLVSPGYLRGYQCKNIGIHLCLVQINGLDTLLPGKIQIKVRFRDGIDVD